MPFDPSGKWRPFTEKELREMQLPSRPKISQPKVSLQQPKQLAKRESWYVHLDKELGGILPFGAPHRKESKPVSTSKPQTSRSKVANLLRSVASFGEGALSGAAKGVGKIASLAGGMAGAMVGLSPKGYLDVRVKEKDKGPVIKFFTEKPLTQTFEEAYKKKVYQPLIKKTPSPKAFKAGHEFGEWVAPTALTSLVGGPVAGTVSTVAKATPVVRTVAPVVARAAVEAPIAKGIVEAGKPKEERTGLPETMLYWAGGELAGKAVGAAGKALASRLRNAVIGEDILKVELPVKLETAKVDKLPTRPKTMSAETTSTKRQKLAQNMRNIAQRKKQPTGTIRAETAETPVASEVASAKTASIKRQKLARDIRNIAQGKKQTTSGKIAKFFDDTGTLGAAKLNIPEKGSIIEGTTQKVRSFPVSVARSPKTKDELKFGVLAEIYEGGRGAYEPVKLKDVYAQAGEIVDKTPDVAVSMVYGEGKPSALQTAVGIRLIEKYQNEGDFDKAIDAALTLSEKLTRNGQAIAAARLINWATPEGAIITAQRQIRNTVKGLTRTGRMSEEEARLLLENPASEEAQAVAQKYGLPTLTPDIAEKIKGLTDVLQNAKDEAARWEAMAELKAFLQSLKPSSLLRKISTAQIIAQLFNLKTQIRNILGNELFYRLERINKFVATPIDWARTKLTGKPRTITFSTGGQSGFWEGFLKGWSAGWKGVSPHGLETQFDIGKGLAFNPQGNPAERVLSFLERALRATMYGFDYAAYNRAYKQTLGELAVLRAINEGQKATKELIEQYMREADANLMSIAEQYGKYVTFQDDNLISKTLASVKQIMNFHKEFGLGDLVLKYPRTPGALLARGLEYSPAGFVRSAYQIIKAVQKGTVENDIRDIVLGLSRAITGTVGLTGLGYFLYDVGVITGPTETDSDVAAMQRQLGTHPYRVNVTALKRWVMSGFNPDAAKPQEGDLFVSYDWAQPVAMAIAMGANTAKEAENARLKSIKEKVTSVATGIPALFTEGISAGVETLVEQPVLSGVLRFFTRHGNEPAGQSITRNLIYAMEGAPASFVPTLLSQLRALTDNTARITWSKSPIQQAISQVKYKIPGLASTLPPAYTTLGQPKETYPGGATLFNVFLNPAYVNRYRPTKEQLMPLEVWRETGETTQFPRAVDRYFMIGGRRIDLTPEEMSEYQRILGTLTQRGFSMIPPEMPAQDKKKVMDKIIEQANLAAKVLILARRTGKKNINIR